MLAGLGLGLFAFLLLLPSPSLGDSAAWQLAIAAGAGVITSKLLLIRFERLFSASLACLRTREPVDPFGWLKYPHKHFVSGIDTLAPHIV